MTTDEDDSLIAHRECPGCKDLREKLAESDCKLAAAVKELERVCRERDAATDKFIAARSVLYAVEATASKGITQVGVL